MSDNAKKQMAYEIIFLTHSESLFSKTPEYAPKAHDMMVNGPLKLVPKWNKPNVLSYDKASKEQLKILKESFINFNKSAYSAAKLAVTTIGLKLI